MFALFDSYTLLPSGAAWLAAASIAVLVAAKVVSVLAEALKRLLPPK